MPELQASGGDYADPNADEEEQPVGREGNQQDHHHSYGDDESTGAFQEALGSCVGGHGDILIRDKGNKICSSVDFGSIDAAEM